MKDFKLYCNKIINEWITVLILQSLQAAFYIFMVFGLVCGGIILFIIIELELTFKLYIPFFIILICICLIMFIILTQFELRVLLDLKKFINSPNACINMMEKYSIKEITSELERVCRYLVKDSNKDIPEISRLVVRFKNLRFRKEDS